MGEQREIPEVDTDQVKLVLRYFEAGREAFEGLVALGGEQLVESVWAMRVKELRAIVFERVVAYQAGERFKRERG